MEKIDRQNNCLSLFKLLAAIQVMYGHFCAYVGFSGPDAFDIMIGIFQGVPIFFTFSGLLIWFSFERSADRESYGKYLRKRFWRIYPELWVAVAVEVVCILILYRGWNVRDMALFTVAQSTVFQFWTPDSLRGFGCGTPNGALWTMCVTVQFYIIARFLYKILRDKKWYVWLVAVAASVLLSKGGRVATDLLGIEIIRKLYSQTIIYYLWLFLLGMAAGRFFDRLLPICKKFWIIFIPIGTYLGVTEYDIMLTYGVFRIILILLGLLGLAYTFPKLKLKKDISYGLFIYHMIVANVMMTFGWTGGLHYVLIAMAISCLLAYLSTITIGAYCAKKK